MIYTLSAFHLGSRIDLKYAIKLLNYEILKDEQTFVLLKRDNESYIYIKSYGSVVFCNFTDEEKHHYLARLKRDYVDFDNLMTEEYEIEVSPIGKAKVMFNTVLVNTFSIDLMHIVMFNLSQSVALDNYQLRTNLLLEQTRRLSDELKRTGDIGLTRSKLKKFIGRTMVLRTRIAENLLIFETTDLAWSRKKLADLDDSLRKQLNMVERHHGLEYSLGIVKENLDLYKDILQHKHSSMLEWVIIALIFIEIINMIINKIG